MNSFRMLACALRWAMPVVLAACTAAEQSAETTTPAAAVPAEVRTDADRQAIYRNGSGSHSTAVPDATPNRVRLGEQAADINRQKRIENGNTNDPNTSTPESRIQHLKSNAPADTLRRP